MGRATDVPKNISSYKNYLARLGIFIHALSPIFHKSFLLRLRAMLLGGAHDGMLSALVVCVY